MLLQGSEQLNRMLASTLEDFMEEIFKRTLNPTVDAVYNRMLAEWNALPAAARVISPRRSAWSCPIPDRHRPRPGPDQRHPAVLHAGGWRGPAVGDVEGVE